MQAQYSQKKNRIKLRVTTSTGLNLLCTANRSQKIKELLPHIVKLYEEVKQDQGIPQHHTRMFRPFIKYIRKDQFLIAPSQLVGDIFDDNDEVFCQIGSQPYSEILNRQSKHQKPSKPSKNLPHQPKTQSVPKTKKIKKKDLNKQAHKNQQQKVNQDSKKLSSTPIKQLQKSINEGNPQNTTKESNDLSKQHNDSKSVQQLKQMKKKNKNKNTTLHQPNPTPQGQKSQSLNANTFTPKVIHIKKPVTSGSQKQKGAMKKPNQQQKQPNVSLLSSQDFSKIRQMMRKSSSASTPV